MLVSSLAKAVWAQPYLTCDRRIMAYVLVKLQHFWFLCSILNPGGSRCCDIVPKGCCLKPEPVAKNQLLQSQLPHGNELQLLSARDCSLASVKTQLLGISNATKWSWFATEKSRSSWFLSQGLCFRGTQSTVVFLKCIFFWSTSLLVTIAKERHHIIYNQDQ